MDRVTKFKLQFNKKMVIDLDKGSDKDKVSDKYKSAEKDKGSDKDKS